MLRKYKIKECPEISQVISVTELPKICDKNGMLIFQANTPNEDCLNDLTEALGTKFQNTGINIVVAPWDMKVCEVIEHIEKLKEDEANEQK